MDVRVDQAGEHHLAGGVDPLDPVGDADVASHRLDPAVAEQHDPVLQGRAGDRDDPPAHNRQPSSARGRVQAPSFPQLCRYRRQPARAVTFQWSQTDSTSRWP